MTTSQIAAVFLALLWWTSPAIAQIGDELRARLERADLETVRLRPADFDESPEAVKATLSRLGCRIPQAWGSSESHNLIRGEFTGAGQIHWAALCSRERSSRIIVLDDHGSIQAELASRPDIDLLQGMGDERISFSRQLSAVGREFILSRPRVFGAVEPPPVDHQGIEDSFLGKASTVLYFDAGEWLELRGSD
jgi:hypothetical protein